MSLSIRYQNTRGLRTKVNEFSSNILNNSAQMHVITESWLYSDINTSEYLPNDYISHRRDRNYNKTNSTMGGGCWLFHKDNISTIRRYDLESDIAFVEDLWVQVELANTNSSLFICAVYITSMPNNVNLYKEFANSCRDSISKIDPTDRLLIIGDFNVREIFWTLNSDNTLDPILEVNSDKANELLNLSSFGNLRQRNAIQNEDNKILDLVLSSDHVNAVQVSESSDYLVSVDKLYHPPLDIIVQEQVEFMPTYNHKI